MCLRALPGAGEDSPLADIDARDRPSDGSGERRLSLVPATADTRRAPAPAGPGGRLANGERLPSMHVSMLLGVYVLGGLQGEEEARVRAHLARCGRCHAEHQELADVPLLLDLLPREESETEDSGTPESGTPESGTPESGTPVHRTD